MRELYIGNTISAVQREKTVTSPSTLLLNPSRITCTALHPTYLNSTGSQTVRAFLKKNLEVGTHYILIYRGLFGYIDNNYIELEMLLERHSSIQRRSPVTA